MNYIVNVEAAILYENKYLVIVRGQGESYAAGILAFVGGKMEETQNAYDVLEDAVHREVLEEIGITVTNIRYAYSSHFIGEAGALVLDIVFLCDYASGTAQIRDYHEVAEILHLSAEEILEHPKSPIWLKQGIERLETMRRQQAENQ